MNRNERENLKIIISIIVIVLIIMGISYYHSIMFDNQKLLNVNHRKINTNNLTAIENKNVGGDSNISLTMDKNATELLLTVYTNNTSGNVELINPHGHIEIGMPVDKEANFTESMIHSDPPSIVFTSGTWHIESKITGNAHIILYAVF